MIDENRILIVDDDLGIRDLYREILSPTQREAELPKETPVATEQHQIIRSAAQDNYDLVLVDNGTEAVKEVEKAVEQEHPFAVAFIDMKMPGMDGAETAKKIFTADPNIKIVIVTAYSEYTPEDIIRITERDDILYLRKPFNREEIRQFARALTNNWNFEQIRGLVSRELENVHKELEELNRRMKRKIQDLETLLEDIKLF
jgi:two-component system NtrC family sensor kinase